MALIATSLTLGCAGQEDSGSAGPSLDSTYAPTSALGPDQRQNKTSVLVYNGEGAAAADSQALIDILADHDLKYNAVSSSELNAMSLEEIAGYGLILWPGGYAGTASKSLSVETRIRLNRAVVERGVSYIGFCAGAFIAMNAPSVGGKAPEYGFSLLPYEGILPEYEPNGIHQHDSPIILTFSLYGGAKRDLVWYGGPLFPGAREVLARYKTGDPAIIQAAAGKGFVILSAPHPESPAGWTDAQNDSDGVAGDIELAWRLIEAALNRSPQPTM